MDFNAFVPRISLKGYELSAVEGFGAASFGNFDYVPS